MFKMFILNYNKFIIIIKWLICDDEWFNIENEILLDYLCYVAIAART
jgi:hypothetical protein